MRHISHTRDKIGSQFGAANIDAFLNSADINHSPLMLTKKYAVN